MSYWKIIGIALLGSGVASCTTAETKPAPVSISSHSPAITLISVAAASELLNTNQDRILLDVRTPQEFKSGHINGAQNIDFLNADFPEKIAQLDKSTHYVVYCGSGRRSSKATALMEKMGFSNITDVDGGVKAWKAANLPLSK